MIREALFLNRHLALSNVVTIESIRLRSYLFNYPVSRPRRLRSNMLIRNMVAETMLRSDDFVMPLFIREDISEPEP